MRVTVALNTRMISRALLIGIVLLIAPIPVKAAVSWVSYSDEARTVQCDLFDQYGAMVYMKASGLAGVKSYRAKYYDAQNSLLQTEDGLSQDGIFLSQIKPASFPSSAPGSWTASLYALEPKERLLASDGFEVTSSAIPEFSSVLSVVIMVIICSYWWQKKRRPND